MTEQNDAELSLLQTRVAPEIARKVRVEAAKRAISSAEILRQFIADSFDSWVEQPVHAESQHVS